MPQPAEPVSLTDDAWVHVREAQRLLGLGRIEDGGREAEKAKELFLRHDERPAWVILETIPAGNVKIEVQLNLRDDGTKPSDTGIVTPFSFRVLTDAPENRLVEAIDFEIGMLGGKPNTAALARRGPSQRINFGMLAPDSDYKTIRERVLQLSATRYAAIQLPSTTKQFLNISLPAGSRFTPLILSASSNRTIVARVCSVSGLRDIQVLENLGEGWQPIGANGDGITGVDGNFLTDALIGPNGQLWVLAAYTRPSNSERGETHWLYTYNGARWELAGPENGHPSGTMGDCGLFFLGPTLIHYFVGYDLEQKRHKPYLLYLDGKRWEPVAAQSLLRQQEGELVWAQSNACYLVSSERAGTTTVNAYLITGPGEKDVSGPVPVVEVPGTGYVFRRFAMSADGKLAVMLSTSDQNNREWFCCVIRGFRKSGTAPVEKLPAPPISYVRTIMWSPKGELAIAGSPGGNAVAVYAFRDGEWAKIAEASQPREEGLIFDHRLLFSIEGIPIVTWEDFFRR